MTGLSLREAALAYAARGWAVFPLTPKGKAPLLPASAGGRGCRDATCDPARIAAWWSIYSTANIGLATGPASGLFVVDLDSPEAERAYRGFGGIGIPAVQRTGRGWHLAYAWTPECDGFTNSAGRIAPGLDTRGDGGYIVAAPSVHPDGHRYRWTRECDPSPSPGWLLAKLRPPPAVMPRPFDRRPLERVDGRASRYGMAALRHACERIACAAPGTQEPTLNGEAFSIGGLVAGGELDGRFAAELLRSAALAMANGDPSRPWTAQDIDGKLARAFRAGDAKPRRAA